MFNFDSKVIKNVLEPFLNALKMHLSKCKLDNKYYTNGIYVIHQYKTPYKYAAMKITHYKYGFLDYLQGVRRK